MSVLPNEASKEKAATMVMYHLRQQGWSDEKILAKAKEALVEINSYAKVDDVDKDFQMIASTIITLLEAKHAQ